MSAEQSLRERKKQQTLIALHTTALDLALQQGPETVTVQKIADSANVSVRTFFNYFESKDDAIIGICGTATGELLSEFSQSTTPLADPVLEVVKFIWEFGSGSIVPGSSFSRRRKVMLDNPHLMERVFDRVAHLENRLEATVNTRLALTTLFANDGERQDTAHVLVNTSIGMLKFTVRKAFESADTPGTAQDAFPHPQSDLCAQETALPDWPTVQKILGTYIDILRKLIS
ncbi:MAG: TetR/AcrR family transcriptional regulator [Propionibacteriaceae bacterium]|nr:TetR/AcrR family transcriptional regulator [Propionibacteriaceae bacterium]